MESCGQHRLGSCEHGDESADFGADEQDWKAAVCFGILTQFPRQFFATFAFSMLMTVTKRTHGIYC
jgi:hypothetical protein